MRTKADLTFMQWLDPVTKRKIQRPGVNFKRFQEENEKRKRMVRHILNPKTGDLVNYGIKDIVKALREVADELDNE